METIILKAVLLLVVFFAVCLIRRSILSKRNRQALQRFSLTCKSVEKFSYKFYQFLNADGYGLINNAATVLLKGYKGFRKVFETDYKGPHSIRKLRAVICEKDGVFELRNHKLQLIACGFSEIDPIYIKNGYFNSPVYYKVKKNGLFGITDYEGQVIVPCGYERIQEEIFSQSEYSMWSSNSDIYTLRYVYFVVGKKEKFGVCNREGTLIIPCEYQYIYAGRAKNDFLYCQNNLYFKNEETTVMDGKGEIIAPVCNEVIKITQYGAFVRKHTKFLFIRNGKTVIESEKPLGLCEFMAKKITDGKNIYDLNGNLV